MSMIRCKNNCNYQEEGYCKLDKVINITNENIPADNCVHFIPKNIKSKEEKKE